MSRMTKTQAKRMVNDILAKSKKLYIQEGQSFMGVVSNPDFVAVEKICKKWIKRLG